MASPIRSSSPYDPHIGWAFQSDEKKIKASQSEIEEQKNCFSRLVELIRARIGEYYDRGDARVISVYEKLDRILKDYDESLLQQGEGFSDLDCEKLADELIELVTIEIPYREGLEPPDTATLRISEILWIATEVGFFGLLEHLLQRGADINQQDQNGDTALLAEVHFAMPESIDFIELFLQYGADVKLKNFEGETSLSIIDRRIIDAKTTEEQDYLEDIKALLLRALCRPDSIKHDISKDPLVEYRKQQLLRVSRQRSRSI